MATRYAPARRRRIDRRARKAWRDRLAVAGVLLAALPVLAAVAAFAAMYGHYLATYVYN